MGFFRRTGCPAAGKGAVAMQPHPFLRKKEAAEPPSLRQRNPLQDRAAAYGGKIALCLALTLLLSLLHGTVSPARADGEQADTAAILAGQAVAYATNSGPAISPHSPAYPPAAAFSAKDGKNASRCRLFPSRAFPSRFPKRRPAVKSPTHSAVQPFPPWPTGDSSA